MSKSTIWNSLKQLGYDSKQLKADYNKTYQSANESLLQSILNKLQPTVINEVIVTDDAVQDIPDTTEATIDEQVISASEVNLDSSDTTDTATFEVINQPIVTMPVEVTTVDDPWLTTEEIKYLPTNHYHGIPYRNIDEVTLVNGTKATVIENDTYFLFYTDKKPEDGIGANYSFLKSCSTRQQYQQTYGIKGADKFIKQYHSKEDNEQLLIHFLLNYTKTPVQSSTTANEVNVPKQVQQHSKPITEVTEQVNEVNNMNTSINGYAFKFQEQKLPINVLEVYSINGKKVQVVNLTDAYFVELRDDKLYVSFGLNIKTFKASDYRIIKAFNSLLNGSNFIHLRDLREANRDILVNLNRVKTIERKKDKIVFHWNSWLTYPGYHDLNDWQIID